LYADRRGDILAAQGKREEARAAWQSAIDGLGTANPLTQVVQLKLDALSGA
jgi:predicted negative regulator of RcsB-dependent stress response